MPIYEYECNSCKKIHEVSQKMSDAPLSNCPDCQAPVRKIISLSSFALKGSGYYTTDYKRKPAETAPCGSPAGSCGNSSCSTS